MKKIFLYSFILFSLFIFFASTLTMIQFHKPINIRGDKYVFIEKGDSFREIAEKLKNNNIIDNKSEFIYISKIVKFNKINIKAGEYEFNGEVSMKDILKKLITGKTFLRKITISEGLANYEVVDIIENTNYLTGILTEEIKEGDILPETYMYSRGETKNEIIRRMKQEMASLLDLLWEDRIESNIIKTKEDALVLASIVEKETGLNGERRLVASVFLNRLNIGMRLQSDPTVIYTITKGKYKFNRLLTKNDLQLKSEYNTYRTGGLPPSPICNPGKEAIKAVLNPVQSDFLYFVANGKGGHNFSKTNEEHNFYVNEYRKNK